MDYGDRCPSLSGPFIIDSAFLSFSASTDHSISIDCIIYYCLCIPTTIMKKIYIFLHFIVYCFKTYKSTSKFHRHFLWLLLSYLYITFIYNLLLTGSVYTSNANSFNSLFPNATCIYYTRTDNKWKGVKIHLSAEFCHPSFIVGDIFRNVSKMSSCSIKGHMIWWIHATFTWCLHFQIWAEILTFTSLIFYNDNFIHMNEFIINHWWNETDLSLVSSAKLTVWIWQMIIQISINPACQHWWISCPVCCNVWCSGGGATSKPLTNSCISRNYTETN